MLHSNAEPEKLFSKLVPITLKDGSSNQSRMNNLVLTIEWQESTSRIYNKELSITLTDNIDPFFLYNLCLSEEDYKVLQNHQGLLIDFSSFPRKFIDLIEQCLSENTKPQPKFLLVLSIDENVGSNISMLEVVEINQIKHLTHLSLKFLVASELSVKQYVTARYKKLKEENQNIKNKLCCVEKEDREQLDYYKEQLEKKSHEIEILRKECSVELNLRDSRHARELQEEKEKFLKRQKEEEARMEKEKFEKENNFKKQIQDLESKITCLENLTKENKEEINQKEEKIGDLRNCFLSVEKDLRVARDNLIAAKQENDSLEREVKEKRKLFSQQKNRTEELELEIDRRKKQVYEMQEQLERNRKRIKNLEDYLDENKDIIKNKETECDTLKEEISKANSIIRKLQKQIAEEHEKSERMNRIAIKANNFVQEKDKVIHQLKNELARSKNDYEKSVNEAESLNEECRLLKEQIFQLEVKLRDNQKVKNYLQDLLNKVPSDNFLNYQRIFEPTENLAAGDNRNIQVKDSFPVTDTTKPKSFLPRKKASRFTTNDLNKNHKR